MKKKAFSVFMAAVLVVCMSISLISATAGAAEEEEDLPTIIAEYLEEMRSSASWAPVTFAFPDVEAVFNWTEMKAFHAFSEETQAMIALGMYGQLTDAAAFLESVAGRFKAPKDGKFCLTVAPYVNYLMQTNFHIVLTTNEKETTDNRDGLVICRTDDGYTVERVQTKIDICALSATPAPAGTATASPLPEEPTASPTAKPTPTPLVTWGNASRF